MTKTTTYATNKSDKNPFTNGFQYQAKYIYGWEDERGNNKYCIANTPISANVFSIMDFSINSEPTNLR